MDTAKKVAKNTLVMISGTAIDILIKFVIVVYLARYLGVEAYGLYTLALALVALFEFITDLGINRILVREMSKDNSLAPSLVGNMLSAKLLLSFLAMAISVAWVNVLNYPQSTKLLVYIALPSMLFPALGLTLVTIFQVYLKMEYYVIANIIARLFFLGAIFWIISTNSGLAYTIAAYTAMGAVNLLMVFIFARKLPMPNIGVDLGLWKTIFKESAPLGIVSIAAALYTKLNIIILSKFQNEAAIGFFSSAGTLLSNLQIIPMALAISLYPLLSSYSQKPANWSKAYRLGLKFMLVAGIPISIGVFFFSTDIIQIVYGEKFLPGSAEVLKIYVISLVFLFIHIISSDSLVSLNKQTTVTKITVFMAIVNLSLTAFLAPTYSYIGAAIAVVIAEVVGALAFLIAIRATVGKIFIGSDLIKIGLANALLAVFLWKYPMQLWVAIPISGLIYLAGMIAFKVVSEEDKEILKRCIPARLGRFV